MIDIFSEMKTPKEIGLYIANQVKNKRKEAKTTQEQFALKSGVSLGSLKRFETKGEISFISLIKIAMAFGLEEELLKLFSKKEYISIEEVINENNK